MNDEPRRHMYAFAHRYVPGFGLERPATIMAVLARPEAGDFLMEMWNDLGSQLEPEDRMEFPELTCEHGRRGDYASAVIYFPEPKGTTEPYFSAFLFGPIKELTPETLKLVQARYFVLEKGFCLEPSAARTVLGEWTKEAHLNYGDGPAPSAEAFLDAIYKLVGSNSNRPNISTGF